MPFFRAIPVGPECDAVLLVLHQDIDMTTNKTPPILLESIGSKIFVTRGQRIMLDEDLAILYGVETKVLLQAVKRNLERFPDAFMFQPDAAEWKTLRSQFVTSNEKPAGRGGRRYAPYAFTEQGIAMLKLRPSFNSGG
jgi:hypothetical protein